MNERDNPGGAHLARLVQRTRAYPSSLRSQGRRFARLSDYPLRFACVCDTIPPQTPDKVKIRFNPAGLEGLLAETVNGGDGR